MKFLLPECDGAGRSDKSFNIVNNSVLLKINNIWINKYIYNEPEFDVLIWTGYILLIL